MFKDAEETTNVDTSLNEKVGIVGIIFGDVVSMSFVTASANSNATVASVSTFSHKNRRHRRELGRMVIVANFTSVNSNKRKMRCKDDEEGRPTHTQCF